MKSEKKVLHIFMIVVFSVLMNLTISCASSNPVAFSPIEFTFQYTSEADGLRRWYQVSNTNWVEEYPNIPNRGNRYFVFVNNTVHNGIRGIRVQALDDRDFFVFIPNRSEKNQQLYMTWSARGLNNWIHLGVSEITFTE